MNLENFTGKAEVNLNIIKQRRNMKFIYKQHKNPAGVVLLDEKFTFFQST
jgi:hypothetical protein